MNYEEILSKVDHTLLKQTAAWNDIKELCDEAASFKTASVCIPPSYVKRAAEYLDGRIPVCTVIGFPNGYSSSAAKLYEAGDALANGASEIDMVINLGDLRDHQYTEIQSEICSMKSLCGTRILKVIIETCLLSEDEKIKMCKIVTDAGADYIKTSTGFSSSGATFEDVALFARHIGPDVRIKAAGGISSFEDAEHFIDLGASRLGTSRLIKLAKEKARL